MTLGQRILELRKMKGLSQEEVADKLDVTRQTVSKWETDQSTPDLDKIIPICDLFEISSDELLTGNKNEEKEEFTNMNSETVKKQKKAKGIALGVLIYFVAVAWIMTTVPVFNLNPILSAAGFLLICGVATYFIVYSCIVFKTEEKAAKNKNTKIRKQIEDIIAIIFVIIYLLVSFLTGAWHITWIMWIAYGLISEILKLIFMLKENSNEE